jgi:hypothetical protein
MALRGGRRFFIGLLFLLAAVAIPRTASGEENLLSSRPVETDPLWSVFIFGGTSVEANSFVVLMATPWDGQYGRNNFLGGAVSGRLGRFYDNFIVDLEVGAGYRFKNFSSPETWVALYLRYDGFPWNHVVYTTVAVNTGLSYVEKVSPVEIQSCLDKGNPKCSRLLHYLGPEITFAAPDNRNSEIVIRWHHRSGIFGFMNNAWGGSNILAGGFRQHF